MDTLNNKLASQAGVKKKREKKGNFRPDLAKSPWPMTPWRYFLACALYSSDPNLWADLPSLAWLDRRLSLPEFCFEMEIWSTFFFNLVDKVYATGDGSFDKQKPPSKCDSPRNAPRKIDVNLPDQGKILLDG